MKTDTFDKLFNESVDTARDVLRQRAKGESLDKDAISTLRSVSSIISAWTRVEQTRSARDTTLFFMARELTSSKEQLGEYLRLSMPHLRLPAPSPEPVS